MKFDLSKIDTDELVKLAVEQLKTGGKELVDELKNDEDKKLAQDTMETLAKETFKLLKTDDEAKIEYHRQNITLCKGTLESLQAAVALKCYYRTIDIVGGVIGAVAVGAVKAMI